MQHPMGHQNAQTLFGVEKIPCDHPMRTLLDPMAPSHFAPVVVAVLARRAPHHRCDRFRVLGDQLCVAMDGTNAVSSPALSCQHCLRRPLSNGHTRSDHSAITPGVVCPGRAPVIA